VGSNPSRPTKLQLQNNTSLLTKPQIQSQANLLTRFVNSRREGISPRTIDFYRDCLTPFAEGYEINSDGINSFLANLNCGNAKLNYYRAIKAFCNWLHKQGYIGENPIRFVDAPKPTKQILPSLTMEQVQYLMEQANNLRDKAIISLLADSGMRLNELANIHASDIDLDSYTITIIGKGNKQRKAPFTERTATLLRQWLSTDGTADNIWHMEPHGIQTMLRRLELETGIKCNAHSFRRGFACNLHRKGLSTLDIMHLGGWEDLSMVLRYTRSITFEDCLEHFKAVLT
jgi:site-specific recombinase XerD